jgi:hypothetical protein
MIRLQHILISLAVTVAVAGCKRELVSPPVTTTAAKPDLVCTEQLTTPVVLSGAGFAPAIENALNTPALHLPKVTLTRTQDLNGASATGTFVIPDDPAHPDASRLHWSSKHEMTLQVFPELLLSTGLYDITVLNPDGTHTATAAGALAAVPRPTVAAVTPDVLCDAEDDQTVVLTGTNFVSIASSLPVVRMGEKSFTATKVEGCKPVPGAHLEGDVEDCASATFVIPKGTFAPGPYAISVTNPAPVNCVSSDQITVTVVPPPTVSSIVADLVCDAQADQPLTVIGMNFLKTGSTFPTVKIGGMVFTPTTAQGCEAVPGTFREGLLEECASLALVVPRGTFAESDNPVSVTNPPPANCSSLESVNLHVAPPPSLMSAQPVAVCDAQGDQTITLTGTKFLQVAAVLPTVTIGGQIFTPKLASGCTAVPQTFAEGTVQECTGLSVVVPKGTFAQGVYAVLITNPLPAGCATTEMVTLTIDDPPIVTGTVPATLCQGGGTLQVNGSGFRPSSAVSLQATGLPTLSSASTTVNAAGTQLSAQMQGEATPGDVYDLVVDNSDGCTDAAPHQHVTIVTGPVAFFADPDVVYNGINTRVTVYVTTLMQPLPLNAVQIMPAGKTTPVTTLAWSPVPGHPNRVQVVVPEGQAPGSYDLTVNDATGCATVLAQALTVTNALTVSIKDVVAPFAFTGASTAVTIFRDTAAAANKPFVATPRVFLNPSNPQPTDIAISLASVSFTNADTLTAVVPANEPVHAYDLVVVNPDGTVGLLPNAFTVQSVPPPTISSVTPSSLVQATGQVVAIAGKYFSGSTVTLSCKDSGGNVVAAPSAVSGAVACDAQQNCTQQATIDASSIPAGGLCVVRETNADSSFFDYSAVGVTNSSLNLPSSHNGTNMTVGRRALVAASGNATAAARYVYAIGGDSGASAASAPFSSVESASVDLFGNMGAWQAQANPLNTPRSFAAGVTMGRYLYVLGGSDGTTALNTAERAEILDPSEVPHLDVDDIVPNAAGLDAGYWIYRVAATFTANDADNPGGESLASDELIVKVPAFAGKKIQVVLAWQAPVDQLGVQLPNVSGYRIYRTAIANGASGSEVLLTSVSAATVKFADDGSSPPGTAVPLPLGSTGHWAQLPVMGSARKGLAGAAAFDPSNPQKFYVYGLLGLNASNVALASYEYLPVTIQPNGHQTLGTWTTGASTSITGRWQLNAWTADASVASTIPAGSTYVYLGGGLLANGSTTGKVEAGKVSAGGDLGALSDTPKDFSTAFAGYGVCAANDQLFAFGGQGGAPSVKVVSATLVNPAPTLANNSWNSGASMNESRYLLGSTVQSAFIFLVGGATGSSAASPTTELVIW